ncbi:MAG: TonB-dependent receptor, partial [Chitinophagaceae bacterium]
MLRTKQLVTFLLVLLSLSAWSQKKMATVSGRVVDESDQPLAKVSVIMLGKQTGITTSDSGRFSLKVPADKAFALVFSYAGYKTEQRNFYLSENEQETVIIRLYRGTKTLDEVVVSTQPERTESGLIRLNPKNALIMPSPIGGRESMIKIFVGSNNELTSQYAVRGGNYDENLIYVNDFEVFRPYLVRSGQQEGLSFINPELAGKVNFYNGGFQSRYGDRMSSALDIQYRKPKKFGGSAYLSLLEQGFHVEGTSAKEKFTYLVGLRQRTNRGLLSSQETQGSYIPTSTDIQAQFTWQLNPTWQLEALTNFARTSFTLIPEYSQLTTSVFSPVFSANLGVDIYFEGKERDRYATNMLGLAASQQVNKNLRLKWMFSRFENDESENYDIIGAYLFGERDFDRSKPTFGLIVNPLGAGVYHQFARNQLNIVNWAASHKGQWVKNKQFMQWGLTLEKTLINDKLNEWERLDSAGYTLPFIPGRLPLSKVLKSSADLDINKISGYIQDNIVVNDSLGITLQAGLRFNFNGLNREFLLSPRLQFSWMPRHKKDLVFKASAGAYHQPPFYREMRRYDGTINKELLAQRSWQIVTGMDYQFKIGNRPFKFSTEAYYKQMSNVVPYDIDNVRIRYFGENSAKAYATGIEMRLIGEWVKDAESWFSIGFMRTRENLDNDYYFNFYNKDGELITGQTEDQVIADSARVDVGWLRRPTDRLFTMGLFFQDYLSTNKNFKVHLNLLYGSNMPYNIPNSVKY